MSGSTSNAGSVALDSGSDPIVVSATSTSTGTSGSSTTGTRDVSQTPFASDSVFNLPLGSDAQWQANPQLSSANVFVNTTVSGFNENIYTGTASDPLVTVTNDARAGGVSGSFQVHIPADAGPAPGGDSTLTVDDTTSGTWYSFGGFSRTGPETATVGQASAESDSGSGISQVGSNFDEGVGTLRESDLQAGTINHMLRIELPTNMLMSYTNSPNQLAPYAWPLTQEDGFAVNGNGGTPYSGTIPFGVTIGIAANAVEPDAVKANAGADMLWHALQDHGAMIRDSGGAGNTVILQADQNVSQNDPLIQGMVQFGSQIMPAVEILTNQGPNSVNGGGTPVVPLDPQVNNAAAAAPTPTLPPTPTPITGGKTEVGTTGTAIGTANSDTATITSGTLFSGQSNSGSPSGMTFVTSSDPSSTTGMTPRGTSSSSLGTDPTITSDISSTAGFGVVTSRTDFTPPTSSSGSSFSPQSGSLGAGQTAWWTSQPTQAAIPVQQG